MQYIYFVQYEAQTGEIKINNKVSINTQTGEIIINNKVSSNNSLNQIIQGWNQRTSLNIGLSKKSFPFIFVRHEKEDWAQHVNKTNKRLYLFAQENHKSSSNRNLPIIHFTDINIFDESSSNAKDAYRYKKVVDSSIWNFYIWKEKGKTIDMLKDAIDKIGKYSDEERYSLDIAHEYADINARLVEQSFLNGSHKDISPFLFHSEHEMYEKIQNPDSSKKGVSLETICNYKWRFLLLDDKSIKPMGIEKSITTQTNSVQLNKLQIITDNLQVLGFKKEKIWFRTGFGSNGSSFGPQHFGKVMDGKWTGKNSPNNMDEISVVIDCVERIEDAKECMMHYKYEIILLDYLLDGEYSYELLEEIRDWHKDDDNNNGPNSPTPTYHPGPNKRFFFMFISAYTTAVNERLLERGMSKTERRLWYIGDGACPTNTPYLFSYQLLDRMKHRVSDLKKEDEAGKLSLIELMEEIFLNNEENDVRKNAHEHFRHILYMRSKYLRLENDLSSEDEHKFNADEIMNMKSSLLIHSAFHFIHHFSGAFYEHLQHLIYLIAYGTIRQWTELWEEYVFVHKTFSEYDSLMEKKLGKKVNKGQAINDAIREYIINLKENCN